MFRTEDVECTASRRRRLVRGGREMRDGGRMGGLELLYLSGTVDELLSSRMITSVARATKLGTLSGCSI